MGFTLKVSGSRAFLGRDAVVYSAHEAAFPVSFSAKSACFQKIVGIDGPGAIDSCKVFKGDRG